MSSEVIEDGLPPGGHQETAAGAGGPPPSPKVYAMPRRTESEEKIARSRARLLQLPYVDPLAADVEPRALRLLPAEIARRRQALPVRIAGDCLLVAMRTPQERVAVRSLELLTGLTIRPAVAPAGALAEALARYYPEDGRRAAESRSQRIAGPGPAPRAPAAEPNEGSRKACKIAVISNKGGVGKTHLSINLACLLARQGEKVLLIDADLGNADVSNKLALFPKHHLMDFLDNRREMSELICRTKFGFDLIASSYGEFKLANLCHAQKVKFIKHFRRVSGRYRWAVFDLGAGISRTVIDFALAAEHTIVVTTPQDLISGYACIKAAFERFKEIEEKLGQKLPGYTPQRVFTPLVALNQETRRGQGAQLFETLQRTAEAKINSREPVFRVRLEYLGAVPYDKAAVRAAETRKQPLSVCSPHCKVSQSYRHLAGRFRQPEDGYDPEVTYRNPLRRFAAILTQRI